MVVTTSGRAAEERLARRQRLALARLAEQREGVWLRPDNIDLVPDPADDPHLTVFTAVPDGDPAALAAGLWDLAGWARRARDAARPAGAAAHRPGPADLAPGFELSAAVLRHLQADPLLPDRAAARRLARSRRCGTPTTRWDRQYRQVLTGWGRSTGLDYDRPAEAPISARRSDRPTGRPIQRRTDADEAATTEASRARRSPAGWR